MASTALRLRSPAPEVKLVKSFDRAFDNAIATARTCYSAKGIVGEDEVSGTPAREERRDNLARDLYAAGHHTTLQHAHFQFALSNVSRHFIWSFLHSHPFYNSEQVSQRYVEVRRGSALVPPLQGEALAVYEQALRSAEASYHRLIELLEPLVAGHYYGRFPGRRHLPDRYGKDVRKKAQEIARYVLPVATFAYLYHTVSGITLLRYARLADSLDVPTETRIVVGAMREALLAAAPEYRAVLEEPLPGEQTPEVAAFEGLTAARSSPGPFLAGFDRSLEGGTSRLIDWGARNEETVAEAAREVLGLTSSELSDDDALSLLLDPARNRYLGEALVLSTHSKLMRCLFHARYVFRKKLSHTADSQDQRHRMTPGSRPVLAAHLTEEPDFILPRLVEEDPTVRAAYGEAMERAWAAIARLRALGVEAEHRQYLLPNAVSIRFTESADLLHLHHKLAMRLCWNSQEEIWKASLEEAQQVAARNPRLGRWLLPPCGLRDRARIRPTCPEGSRYCGVPVWRLPLAGQERIL